MMNKLTRAIKRSRVAVIGTGMVGMSYAYALLPKGLFHEMVLIDVDHRRAEGEAMDLNHALPFAVPMQIWAGTYEDCKHADVVVITAGANQAPGETRLDLATKNINIMRSITEQLMNAGFQGIILVASNPVDVLTAAVATFSGLPHGRVIGTGTVLDTARFRYLLGHHFQVDPHNVHAYIIGEHGDSELPVWSHAYVGAKQVLEILDANDEQDCATMDAIFKDVVTAAYQIIQRKRATYYAIGMGLLRVSEAIMHDEKSILTASVNPNGAYGMQGLCIGLPAVIDRDGVREVVELNLSAEEREKLHASASVIESVLRQNGL
jgi:L-lactate dehydrogenase